jgi:hypothetical protein
MEKKLTRKIRLYTNLLAPAEFAVTVQETNDGSEKVFEVTRFSAGLQVATGVYKLKQRTQEGYLNLFIQLADAFALRVPMNRKKDSSNFQSDISLNVVLTENLASGMWYGYGNPSIIRVQGITGTKPIYYLTVTSNNAPDAFPLLYSADLLNWFFKSYLFPWGKQPAWAATGEAHSDYWAPEIHFVAGEFRVYFVARHSYTHELCIGMARCALPEGPYIPDPEPILKNNVTDPHVLVYDEQTVYLFWKEDNNATWPGLLVRLLYKYPDFIQILFHTPEDQNTASFIITLWPWIQTLDGMEHTMALQNLVECVNVGFYAFCKRLSDLGRAQEETAREEIRIILKYMSTPIYAQQLSADGSALTREKIKVIENDQSWEAHVVEAIWVTRQGDEYYLFYSGNDFSTDQYGIGVAIAKAPLGPYVKLKEPLLNSTAAWWAPGNPTVVAGPDGRMQMFLHAYYREQAGYKRFRALLSVPVNFLKNSVTLG